MQLDYTIITDFSWYSLEIQADRTNTANEQSELNNILDMLY